MIKESLIEALIKSAMNFEEETRNFYLRCMEEATGDKVRKLFGLLAEEELRHKEHLAELLDSDKDVLLNIDDGSIPDIIEASVEGSGSGSGGEAGVFEVLRTALDHETSSFNFYVMLSRKSIIPVLKKTFLFLASEEETHVKHLREMLAELEAENS